MEEDGIAEIEQAQRESSTTGWTGSTLSPLANEALGTQKGKETELAEVTDSERKRVAPFPALGATRKRSILILPRSIETSATESEQTCCIRAKRKEGLAIVEGVASNVFERKEWNTKKLQEELRRRGLPIYGTKAQKRNRLIAHMQGPVGDGRMQSPEDKRMVPRGEREKHTNDRTRSPDFTKHEFARLCEVVASPEWTVALQRTVNPAATREELDAGIEDAWCREIEDAFNDPGFRPDGYRAVEGLEDIDPNLHPLERSGSLLKSRFTRARSEFTIAYSHWSASGQNDPRNFRDFIRGDLKLLYMFFCFRDSPALDFVLRTAPREAQGEEGIPGETISVPKSNKEKTSSIRSSRWKQRESLADLQKLTERYPGDSQLFVIRKSLRNTSIWRQNCSI